MNRFLAGSPSAAARVTSLLNEIHTRSPPPLGRNVAHLATAVRHLTEGEPWHALSVLDGMSRSGSAAERAVEFAIRSHMAGSRLVSGYLAIGWRCLGTQHERCIELSGLPLPRVAAFGVVQACERELAESCRLLALQVVFREEPSIRLECLADRRTGAAPQGRRWVASTVSRATPLHGYGELRGEALLNLLGQQLELLDRCSVPPFYQDHLRAPLSRTALR